MVALTFVVVLTLDVHTLAAARGESARLVRCLVGCVVLGGKHHQLNSGALAAGSSLVVDASRKKLIGLVSIVHAKPTLLSHRCHYGS
jgi:hypothetical protein